MPDTGVAFTQQQCNRLMTGSGLGGPGPCVDTSTAEGNGGLCPPATTWRRGCITTSPKTTPAAWPTLAVTHAVYCQRKP
jgi:serine-type D-Ala-D-Ala carboxypeptidase/endopeptidase